MKKVIKIFLLSFFLIFIFGQNPIIKNTYAADLERSVANSQNKVFLEDVPGMEDLAKKTGKETDPTKMITTYLNWLIRLSVVIGSILAVVYIVIGGVEYMFSDVFAKKSAGKEKIQNAIMGIIFLISGYLIFEEINPNILNLNFGYKPSNASELKSEKVTISVDVSNDITKLDDDPIVFSSIDPSDSGDIPDNKAKDLDGKKPKEAKKEVDSMAHMNTLEYSHFLAQISHESGGFKIIEEHGYSSKRACEVFGKNHPQVCKEKMNPKQIFDYVYGGRMGNNNIGDGSKYKGRGFMQLTGKSEYRGFTNWCKNNCNKYKLEPKNFVSNPELVTQKGYRSVSAIYVWEYKNCRQISQKGATYPIVREITKKINGGYNGLADRWKRFQAIAKKLGLNPSRGGTDAKPDHYGR